jgi:hypothetical protein
MSIEWANTGRESPMTFRIVDPGMVPARNVLVAGDPFDIEIFWEVPADLLDLVGPCDQFRLRAFAESVGPGQEMQVGPTDIVDGVPGQASYTHTMHVTANPLLGEGQKHNGEDVSGLYIFTCVLQHLNGGNATGISGAADYTRRVLFRAPTQPE